MIIFICQLFADIVVIYKHANLGHMYCWFWKRRILAFLCELNVLGHFQGYFEGAKTFVTPKLSWAHYRYTSVSLPFHCEDIVDIVYRGCYKIYKNSFLCTVSEPLWQVIRKATLVDLQEVEIINIWRSCFSADWSLRAGLNYMWEVYSTLQPSE